MCTLPLSSAAAGKFAGVLVTPSGTISGFVNSSELMNSSTSNTVLLLLESDVSSSAIRFVLLLSPGADDAG